MTPTEPTPDERRRAAEWLRQRAEKLFKESKTASTVRTIAAVEWACAMRNAADAYEKGEQP